MSRVKPGASASDTSSVSHYVHLELLKQCGILKNVPQLDSQEGFPVPESLWISLTGNASASMLPLTHRVHVSQCSFVYYSQCCGVIVTSSH